MRKARIARSAVLSHPHMGAFKRTLTPTHPESRSLACSWSHAKAFQQHPCAEEEMDYSAGAATKS